MKKIRHLLFGSKQSKQNQQVKADAENRISQIGRNMSRGASNIFKSLRVHNAIGMLKGRGKNYKSHSKLGQHTPSKKFGK
ncbi:MAG: hypothetical protein AB7F19_04420 [Candidatus Babeliales bacterium]